MRKAMIAASPQNRTLLRSYFLQGHGHLSTKLFRDFLAQARYAGRSNARQVWGVAEEHEFCGRRWSHSAVGVQRTQPLHSM